MDGRREEGKERERGSRPKRGTLPFTAIKSSNMQWGPPQGMLLVNVMTLFNESGGIEH